MTRKWFAVWVFLVGIIFLLFPISFGVTAQEPTPENDANCVACHEHQYYLYDSGKWFCLCEAPMHCVYCHGGRIDSVIEEIAHEGVVLYPTRNHAERCQTCHTEDYMDRVVTFATVAGVSSTPQPIITATSSTYIASPLESGPGIVWRLSQLEPWRLIGLGVSWIALLGIILFGYHCWKSDCLLKGQP